MKNASIFLIMIYLSTACMYGSPEKENPFAGAQKTYDPDNGKIPSAFDFTDYFKIIEGHSEGLAKIKANLLYSDIRNCFKGKERKNNICSNIAMLTKLIYKMHRDNKCGIPDQQEEEKKTYTIRPVFSQYEETHFNHQAEIWEDNRYIYNKEGAEAWKALLSKDEHFMTKVLGLNGALSNIDMLKAYYESGVYFVFDSSVPSNIADRF